MRPIKFKGTWQLEFAVALSIQNPHRVQDFTTPIKRPVPARYIWFGLLKDAD